MKRIGVFAVLIGIIGILSFHGASSTTARSSGSPSFNSVPGFNAVGGPPILAGDFPCTPPPAGCIAPPAGLVGWWSGDGDAKDIQGNNNASLQGGVTFAAGKVGEAFDFRSTPIGRVTVPDDTSFNVQQFTIDAWIKTAPLSRGALVAAKSARTGLSGYELSVHPSGVLRFGLNGEEGGARVIGSINVTDNSFHHVAATYDGSSLKVYVDGNLDAQTPITVTITYPLESPFQIGNRQYDCGFGCSESWLGLIDEIEFFNRALDAGEILAIANAGSAARCKPQCSQPPSGMVSWWPGDGNANDIKGSNNGTLQNTAGFTPGKVEQAFSLNGMNDYVQVADNPSLDPSSGSFTIDAWVKTTKSLGAQMIVNKYECGQSCPQPGRALSLYMVRIVDGRLRATLRDTDGGGPSFDGDQTLEGLTFISDGAFHHIAMVRDITASELRLYVDGVLDASAPLNAGSDGAINNDDGEPDPFLIGARIVGGTDTRTEFFSGLIDEVEYFNRALDAGEILAIANAGRTGKCKTDCCIITCPVNIEASTDPGMCGAAVNYPSTTIMGNCGSVIATPPSGTFFPVGTTTVSVVGPSASCSFTVTITDAEQPAITCPANISVSNDANQCFATLNPGTATATDNCSGVTISGVRADGMGLTAPYPIGTTNIIWAAADQAGNNVSCNQTVTVNDTQKPTISCPADIVADEMQGQCSALVNYNVTAADNCVGVTVVNDPPSGSTFPPGTTTVTSTATDASGNTSTCTFTVTVNDAEAPSITCPGNLTVSNTPGQCSAVVSYSAPQASDNCSGLTTSCSPAPGSIFPKGITTVACSATDAAGNTSSCSFTVMVNDTSPPAVNCPANVAGTASPGSDSLAVTYPTPVVGDNCSATTSACAPPSGSEFPLGVTTVVCTATDGSGNTAQCSFTVTVSQTPPPSPDKIAFETIRDGNLEIYVMNADGTAPIRLTNNHCLDTNPAWSPDRAKIAFTSLRDGNLEIYVMNADGSNQTRLTSDSAIDDDPAWSPDGTKIAFWSSRNDNAEIYVMNADGSNQTRITNHSRTDQQPEWSPDGRKIVFTSNRASLLNLDIYVMNADGSGVTRLTSDSSVDESPDWSGDGTKIVFTSNRTGLLDFEVWVMNADGSNPVRLTSGANTSVRPSWSRDGAKIVFATNRDGLPNFEVYTMNADGSNPMRLTSNSAIDFAPKW